MSKHLIFDLHQEAGGEWKLGTDSDGMAMTINMNVQSPEQAAALHGIPAKFLHQLVMDAGEKAGSASGPGLGNKQVDISAPSPDEAPAKKHHRKHKSKKE